MKQEDYVSINRDPFAREDLVRRVEHTESGCDWCGSNHYHHLFEYGYEPDSLYSRVRWIKGLFCNVQCMRDYHLS